MRGEGLPEGTWRNRRRDEGGRRYRDREGMSEGESKMLVRWSVALVLGVFVVIGIAVWLWMRPLMHRNDVTGKDKTEAPALERRVVSRFASPSREVAMDLVKRALLIRDPAMVTDFFRLGPASPEAVVEFLRNIETVDGAVTSMVWLSSMDANGLLLDGVVVNTKGGEKRRDRLALLTPDDKGRWKIDFDAFARTSKPAWSEILAQSGHGQVRVVFLKDHYFNGPFMDESQWACYRMDSADLAEDLWGYCRKDSPQAGAMLRLVGGHQQPLTGGRKLRRATLEIRRTEGAQARQFEITRVLAEDWVMSATPIDGNGQ